MHTEISMHVARTRARRAAYAHHLAQLALKAPQSPQDARAREVVAETLGERPARVSEPLRRLYAALLTRTRADLVDHHVHPADREDARRWVGAPDQPGGIALGGIAWAFGLEDHVLVAMLRGAAQGRAARDRRASGAHTARARRNAPRSGSTHRVVAPRSS